MDDQTDDDPDNDPDNDTDDDEDTEPLNPGEYQLLTELITQHGWPLTKASYVLAMEFPYFPTFPLDAETLAKVPADLPGELPTTDEDFDFFMAPSPKVPNSPADGRRLPASLVTLAAERHGLTYEEAEELLKEFGA